MAIADRLAVLQSIIEVGIVPVFYHGDADTAYRIALACYEGGARVIEFTNRGDFAVDVFRDIHRRLLKDAPGIMLGVGSIVDAPTAALYINYGAAFVVGPLLNPDVARLCNRRKVAYSPGCGSASEISEAEELGVEIVKVFPGACVGGPDFIKSVLGPCPWTRMMITGAVDPSEESLKSWFGAGAVAVGMGSSLIRADLVKDGKFDELSANVKQVLQIANQVRGKK